MPIGKALVYAVGWSEPPPWLLTPTWVPRGGHSGLCWLSGLTGHWEWFWGPKAFAFVDLSLTAKPHIALSFPPLFLLKDQFFMVLVLIVFIVFKSVFLYVEGNNFLNTNRYYCIKLSWRSSCLINGHVKMVLSFSALTSLLPLRKLWAPVPETGLLRGGWTRPPLAGRGLCGMYRCRQAAWLALLG